MADAGGAHHGSSVPMQASRQQGWDLVPLHSLSRTPHQMLPPGLTKVSVADLAASSGHPLAAALYLTSNSSFILHFELVPR